MTTQSAPSVDVLALLDRQIATPSEVDLRSLRQARAAVSELLEAAKEMMQQDAVQRATEITNPFMAGAADRLASALRKVGAR